MNVYLIYLHISFNKKKPKLQIIDARCCKEKKVKTCKKPNPFPENMELKYFANLIPKAKGTVHTLLCPILNKDLEKELLCGLDPAYSTSNVIIYSGYIGEVGPTPINIFCVDLIIHNKLKNVNTKYLWHGKCFINVASPTEVFLPHDINFEDSATNTVYSMKVNDNLIYEAKLPALNEENYKTYDIQDDEYLTTSHFHIFDYFYTKEVNSYCPVNAKQETSFMTINFGNIEKVYLKKLNNLDDIFIDENFGKNFGFSAPFNKESLDNTNCVASFLHEIKYMDTGRVIAVDKDVNIPPLPTDKSLSTTETMPKPYDNMSKDVIKSLGVLTELQKSNSFDINNAIMDFFYNGEL